MPGKTTKNYADLPLRTTRMIQLLQYVADNRIKGCLTLSNALEKIGYPPSNITNVKQGRQGFRPEHYEAAVRKLNADANWFFLPKPQGMFRVNQETDPLATIEQMVEVLRNKG